MTTEPSSEPLTVEARWAMLLAAFKNFENISYFAPLEVRDAVARFQRTMNRSQFVRRHKGRRYAQGLPQYSLRELQRHRASAARFLGNPPRVMVRSKP